MSTIAAPARPVADGLFEWPADDPRLLAGECRTCGTWAFPTPQSCTRCSGTDIDQGTLPKVGRLWSFTVQRFRPKSPYDGPVDFEPYGVGYVEFPGQLLVEGRLTEADPDRLRIGAVMEVCVIPYTTDPDGTTILTFAFRPADGSQREAA